MRSIPLQPCKKKNPGHKETAGGHSYATYTGALGTGGGPGSALGKTDPATFQNLYKIAHSDPILDQGA
jgi:hypothetical protein